MTREGILKHKEVFDAWLDGKPIQLYLKSKNAWLDVDVPNWDIELEYRIKPKIEFEDCSFNEVEYITQTDATLLEVNSTKFEMSHRKGFIKNKKVAEAYAVLPQLIRLIDEYNKGWKPNYKDGDCKYAVGCYEGNLELFVNSYIQRILVFKTEEIRDKFLEDHRDLIEIAKPLL